LNLQPVLLCNHSTYYRACRRCTVFHKFVLSFARVLHFEELVTKTQIWTYDDELLHTHTHTIYTNQNSKHSLLNGPVTNLVFKDFAVFCAYYTTVYMKLFCIRDLRNVYHHMLFDHYNFDDEKV